MIPSTSAAIAEPAPINYFRKPSGHKATHLTIGNVARLVVYDGGQWAIETRFLGFLWWRHMICVSSLEVGYVVVEEVARSL